MRYYPKFCGITLHYAILPKRLRYYPNIMRYYPNVCDITSHYAILPQIMRYCPKLCDIIPNYAILPQSLRYYTTLCDITTNFAVLPQIVRYYPKSYDITPNFAILHHIMRYCPKLCNINPNNALLPRITIRTISVQIYANSYLTGHFSRTTRSEAMTVPLTGTINKLTNVFIYEIVPVHALKAHWVEVHCRFLLSRYCTDVNGQLQGPISGPQARCVSSRAGLDNLEKKKPTRGYVLTPTFIPCA